MDNRKEILTALQEARKTIVVLSEIIETMLAEHDKQTFTLKTEEDIKNLF